jgi:hypothetical protein
MASHPKDSLLVQKAASQNGRKARDSSTVEQKTEKFYLREKRQAATKTAIAFNRLHVKRHYVQGCSNAVL